MTESFDTPAVPSIADVDQALREKFNRLAAEWRADTDHHSAVPIVYLHDSYQDILGMGPQVLCLILEDLRATEARWLWALRHIAGRDVADGCESYADAVAAWIEWGIGERLIRGAV